jgi:hypothetical protein
MTKMADFKGPSNSEEEYFTREDAEKKRKIAHQVKKETEAAELVRLKALHWMRCPKCGLQLHEVRLRGVDVDVCFSCNGIFLDQGELEHLEKHESKGVMSAILNWFGTEKK